METGLKQVLYLTEAYLPTAAAGGIRAGRFVSAFTNHNCHVTVLTAGAAAGIETPTDHLTVCRITHDGRLPAHISASQLLSWPCCRLLPGPDPFTEFCHAIYQAAQWWINKYRPAIIYVSGPPFSLMTVACRLAQERQIPFVLEFRDAWYTAMPWPYQNVLRRRLARRDESLCLQKASAIVTVTDTHREILCATFGGEIESKSCTVRHGYELPAAAAENSPAATYTVPNIKDRFTLVYTGQFRGINIVSESPLTGAVVRPLRWLKRGLLGGCGCEDLRLDYMSPHYLLAAVAQAAQKNPLFARAVQLKFVGQSYRQIDLWAGQYGLKENVRQLGCMSPDTACRIADTADVLYLCLYGIKDCRYHWCVPSKTYSYLATGKPILGLVPAGETADIIQNAGVGRTYYPDQTEKIAQYLLELFQNHQDGVSSVTPRWDYIQQFALPAQQKIFIQFLQNRQLL